METQVTLSIYLCGRYGDPHHHNLFYILKFKNRRSNL